MLTLCRLLVAFNNWGDFKATELQTSFSACQSEQLLDELSSTRENKWIWTINSSVFHDLLICSSRPLRLLESTKIPGAYYLSHWDIPFSWTLLIFCQEVINHLYVGCQPSYSVPHLSIFLKTDNLLYHHVEH